MTFCVNTPAYACMRVIKGLTTSTQHTTALSTVYKSLVVHEERERLVAQALAIASIGSHTNTSLPSYTALMEEHCSSFTVIRVIFSLRKA